MAAPISIVWFRSDLRLEDQPALQAAMARKGPIIPAFIWAPDDESPWQSGAASRWWLHQSLVGLQHDLERLGSKLIIRRGPTLAALESLVSETSATAVFWNRRYEPSVQKRDAEVKSSLQSSGVEAESFKGSLLFEPWEILNKQNQPYRVFTPFYRACLAAAPPHQPKAPPNKLCTPEHWPSSDSLCQLGLEPQIDWAGGMREAWQPGAAGAKKQLEYFLAHGLAGYEQGRDTPGQEGVSRLSPYLHFGQVSPRQIWHAVQDLASELGKKTTAAAEGFLRQLIWREFAHHLLYHFPQTDDEPLHAEFAQFPWRDDRSALRAWQRGQTGYPFVDAGMRQLWTTGWMHNRVRMNVGSFLVKHLLLPWQAGARWFWDTLVDADLANNTLGWQWVAGCGADAAPYFRIFNPVKQAERFDADGAYVRRWVPELAALPDEWLQQPWAAPRETLKEAGIELGRDYPEPIVDHSEARQRALAALAEMRRARGSTRSKR